jgi:hypothetical protein
MARRYTAPADDEPDAEPAASEPVSEDEVDTAQAEGEVKPLVSNQGQIDTHQATVIASKGTMQSSVQSAVTSYKAGSITLATLAANVKAASIAYYQSVLTSGQSNSMPTPGAIEALRALGAM